MRRNFLSLYKVDIDDRSNFDLLLDTSSLSSAEVFESVSTFIDEQASNI
jgi:cytidylate kinase